MPIDWFTVLAQMLNFLILVWLLKRFLYAPILNALDAREARIAATLSDAANLKAEADNRKSDYESKIETFEAERITRMQVVSEEAQKEHQRLVDESKRAIQVHRVRLEKSLNDEVEQLHQVIRRRTQDAVFSIARTVLEQLANESLEERIVAVFLEKIPGMDVPAKEAFAAALKVSKDVMVRSAFVLSEDSKSQIAETLSGLFDTEITYEFHVVPELISGIELTSHGQKLSWSIDDYLDALVHQVDLVGAAKRAGTQGST